MPDIKNNFLQSKMNKDQDARLVPNGKYRDARNVNISKSEGPDVGAIENIIGNLKITGFSLESSRSEVIGSFCLLYTSPSPRDRQKSRMPSSA